jgi:hypothetical protein
MPGQSRGTWINKLRGGTAGAHGTTYYPKPVRRAFLPGACPRHPDSQSKEKMESNIGRPRNPALSNGSGLAPASRNGDSSASAPVDAATSVLPPPPTIVPPSALVDATRLPGPGTEHRSAEERAQLAQQTENSGLHNDLITAIVRQVNGPGPSSSTLDKARILAQWQRLSRAFRSEIHLLLQHPAMAEVGRRVMTNTIAHLANRGSLNRAGLQNAVENAVQNKQHVGINLAAINSRDHRDVVLDVLERLADLRHDKPLLSLDIQAPEVGGSIPRLLQVLEAVDTRNPQLSEFQLNMERNKLVDADAGMLCRLKMLTSLDLYANGLTEKGAAELVKLPLLTTLNVCRNALGDDGAKILAGHPALARMNISRNKLSIEGLRNLAANTRLIGLDVGENGIGIAGAEVLSTMQSLEFLGAQGNMINSEALALLSKMRNLTTLDVSANGLSDSGAKALPLFNGLAELRVGWNNLTAAGALSIAGMSGLTTLDIAANPIGAEGGRALASMPNLTSLSAWMCDLGFEGAMALAAQARLTHLHIRKNGLDAADEVILKARASASDVVL